SDQGEPAPHLDTCHLLGDATTAHEFPICSPVPIETFVEVRVGDLVILIGAQPQPEPVNPISNDRRAPHQNGSGKPLVDHDLHCSEHTFVFTFREHDTTLAA